MSKMLTKVFFSGRSQAVRIPKEFRFTSNEVFIEKHGNKIVLIPKPRSWDDYFSSGDHFTNDFPDSIEDSPPEDRESFE